MNKVNIALLVCTFFVSCNQFTFSKKEKTEKEDVAVARVFDQFLYEKDIADLTVQNEQNVDSASIVSKYVESWIRKQLIIERANSTLDFDEINIERKVLDYKYALMAHEFEKHYISQHLKGQIPQESIEKYYKEWSQNFVLRQNIVQCLYTVLPLEAPQVDGFRKLIRDYPKSNIEEIKSYCYRFASLSSLEPSVWLSFDEVVAHTPWATDLHDKDAFLKKTSFAEVKDSLNYYFIRVLDYKVTGQIAPLEFAKEDIERILMNKSKIELRKTLEEEILNDAKNNNDFEIY